LTTQWLIQGATDRIRARAIFGTTQVLKLAHFAELYTANIELNGKGGPGGWRTLISAVALITPTITLARSVRLERCSQRGRLGRCRSGVCSNAPTIEDGRIAPPDALG
jgi:hypothetical protein